MDPCTSFLESPDVDLPAKLEFFNDCIQIHHAIARNYPPGDLKTLHEEAEKHFRQCAETLRSSCDCAGRSCAARPRRLCCALIRFISIKSKEIKQ